MLNIEEDIGGKTLEGENKKVIKISLKTTIVLAIILILIMIGTTYTYIKFANKTINEENKNNSENNTNAEKNILNKEQIEKNEQELYGNAQEALKEFQEAQNKEEELLKEVEKLTEQIEEPKETATDKEDVAFEEHFMEGIAISYPNNWHAHREAGYYQISNIDDFNCAVMIHQAKEFIEKPVPEGDLLGKYGSLYYYLYKFVNDGFDEADYITDYLESLVFFDDISNLAIEGTHIENEFWGIISYTNSSGDGLSMYCEKNGWIYAIDVVGINNNNREIINKIINSIMVADG